jgi:hypothetical protein
VPSWHGLALLESWEHSHLRAMNAVGSLGCINKCLGFLFALTFVVECFMCAASLWHCLVLWIWLFGGRRSFECLTCAVLYEETICIVECIMFSFEHFERFAFKRSQITVPAWHGFALSE